METLLDHEASLSPVAREFLTTILKNATRMNRLTEDLLVMARVDSSVQDLHPTAVPASLLVRDAIQAMSGLVQDAEAALEIGELTDCTVFADADSIVQVLSNLIENGIKYGVPRSGGRSRVVVSAREVAADLTNGDEFCRRDHSDGGVPSSGLRPGHRLRAPGPHLRALLSRGQGPARASREVLV